MSTEGLFGNFTFNSLRSILKEKGIKEKDMSSALNKIAEKNNVDDVLNLNGAKKIEIDESIFNIFNFTPSVENPYSVNNNNEVLKFLDKDFEEAMFSPLQDGERFTLPEVYNDDDYEVVDYDDFYSFKDTDKETDNKEQEEEKLDFSAFKEKYEEANKNKAATNINDKKLKEMFDKIDKNSDSYLDKDELKDAKMSFLTQKKDNENTNPLEGEDLLGAYTMESDMSGNAFNPQ